MERGWSAVLAGLRYLQGQARSCSRRSPSTSSRWCSACRACCSRCSRASSSAAAPKRSAGCSARSRSARSSARSASGWVSRIRRQGLAILVAVTLWGVGDHRVRPRRATGSCSRLVVPRGRGRRRCHLRGLPLDDPTARRCPDALRGRLMSFNILVVAGGPRLGDFEARRGRGRVLADGLGRLGRTALPRRRRRSIATLVPRFARWTPGDPAVNGPTVFLAIDRDPALRLTAPIWWRGIRGHRSLRSWASRRARVSRSCARRTASTRSRPVARRCAPAHASARRARRRVVLRDASRRARTPLRLARARGRTRGWPVDRVAEAHRGCRDRSHARTSCATSASRTVSSTTRCARSTTRGRVALRLPPQTTAPSATAGDEDAADDSARSRERQRRPRSSPSVEAHRRVRRELAQQAERVAVVGEHRGDEALEAVVEGDRGQAAGQALADAPVLPGVLDRHRDLGRRGAALRRRSGPRPRSRRRRARPGRRGGRGRRWRAASACRRRRLVDRREEPAVDRGGREPVEHAARAVRRRRARSGGRSAPRRRRAVIGSMTSPSPHRAGLRLIRHVDVACAYNVP